MRMMFYAGGPFVLQISQNLWKPDIRALALAAGWNNANELLVNITSSYIGPIDLGTVPYHSGITLSISSSTRVAGEVKTWESNTFGAAIKTRIPVIISNEGIISGSGGFGGDGGSATSAVGNASASASGGLGGAGWGLVFGGGGLCAVSSRDAGMPGSYDSDTDTVVPPYASCWAQGGDGGDGGDWGQPGFFGQSGDWGGGSGTTGRADPGGPGSQPGAAVDGNSYVTWQKTGSRLGGLIN